MILSKEVKFMRVFNKYILINTCLSKMSLSLCLSVNHLSTYPAISAFHLYTGVYIPVVTSVI